MPVPPELISILQCPECRSPVEDAGEHLVCTGCGLMYPVVDGIPHMLADEAQRPADREDP